MNKTHWSVNNEKILHDISASCEIYYNLYKKSSLFYNSLDISLGLCQIILTSAIGIIILEDSIGKSFYTIILFFSAAFSTIQQFLNLNISAKNCLDSYNRFYILFQNIEHLLLLDIDDRENFKLFYNETVLIYNNNLMIAPKINCFIISFNISLSNKLKIKNFNSELDNYIEENDSEYFDCENYIDQDC